MKDKNVFSQALIHVQHLGTQIISNMNTSSANLIFSFVFESSKNHYLKNGTQIEISQDFQNALHLCDKRSKSWKKNRVHHLWMISIQLHCKYILHIFLLYFIFQHIRNFPKQTLINAEYFSAERWAKLAFKVEKLKKKKQD